MRIGEAVHITSDESLNWNQIFEIVARAAGTEPRMVHVPSDVLAAYDPGWGAGLLGDKSNSMIFDNTARSSGWCRISFCSIPYSRRARQR